MAMARVVCLVFLIGTIGAGIGPRLVDAQAKRTLSAGAPGETVINLF